MQMINKAKNFLNGTHEGAETFEVVVIVAMLVILIILMFGFVGEALKQKMCQVASDIAKAGTQWTS